VQPVYPVPPHCPYALTVHVLVAALDAVVLLLLIVEVERVVVLLALVEMLVVLALELVAELVDLTIVEDVVFDPVVVVMLIFVEVLDDPPSPLTVPEA
jgi:hypothetical protein